MDFYREQRDLIFKTIIDANVNINMSMFYEKKDTYKILKDLTYNIGNVSVDLENSNKNRQDIDLVEFTYDDASNLYVILQEENILKKNLLDEDSCLKLCSKKRGGIKCV